MWVGRVTRSGRRLWWTLKGSATAGVVAGLLAYALFGRSWQQSVAAGAIPAVVTALGRNTRKADWAERAATRRFRWFDRVFDWVLAGGLLSSLAVAGTVMLLRHAGHDTARGSILIAFDLVLIWVRQRSWRRHRGIIQDERSTQPSLGK